MAFLGNVVRILGFFVFSAYCCYCLYLVCTCYWLSTFNKLQSEFHVYHFPPFLLCLIFSFICLQVPGYHAFTIRLWRACVRTFQRFLPTARLLARSRPSAYHGCFKRWKSWASGFPEVIYFPAQEKHVALNLISLVQSGSSYSSIRLFQKKSTPPRRMGFWKFSREGGSKTPEIQAGGGVDLKKVFCRGHFDR